MLKYHKMTIFHNVYAYMRSQNIIYLSEKFMMIKLIFIIYIYIFVIGVKGIFLKYTCTYKQMNMKTTCL